jgi:hypothetical protein
MGIMYKNKNDVVNTEEDDHISEEDDYISEEDDHISEEGDYLCDDDFRFDSNIGFHFKMN